MIRSRYPLPSCRSRNDLLWSIRSRRGWDGPKERADCFARRIRCGPIGRFALKRIVRVGSFWCGEDRSGWNGFSFTRSLSNRSRTCDLLSAASVLTPTRGVHTATDQYRSTETRKKLTLKTRLSLVASLGFSSSAISECQLARGCMVNRYGNRSGRIIRS